VAGGFWSFGGSAPSFVTSVTVDGALVSSPYFPCVTPLTELSCGDFAVCTGSSTCKFVAVWHCTVLVVAFILKHLITATARGCLVLVVCIIIAQAVLRLSTIMMFSAGLLVCQCVSARESTTTIVVVT
jgi:hypothetical protein